MSHLTMYQGEGEDSSKRNCASRPWKNFSEKIDGTRGEPRPVNRGKKKEKLLKSILQRKREVKVKISSWS